MQSLTVREALCPIDYSEKSKVMTARLVEFSKDTVINPRLDGVIRCILHKLQLQM